MTNKVKSPKDFKRACENIKLLLFDCDGVLTDGRIILGSNGMELKFFSTVDGLGLKMWNMAGFLSGCITGRTSEAVERRAKELKMDELHQGAGVMAKGEILEEIITRRGLTHEEVAYIGDDLNDLSVGCKVGLFFVPANHQPDIRSYADYILSSSGGHGAIREIVNIILDAKGLKDGLIREFTQRCS